MTQWVPRPAWVDEAIEQAEKEIKQLNAVPHIHHWDHNHRRCVKCGKPRSEWLKENNYNALGVKED